MAVWRYCEKSVQIHFGDRAGTSLSDRILELLGKGPMTKDEFNPHLSANQKAELVGVLESLERAKAIRKTMRQGATGRPATVWERVR